MPQVDVHSSLVRSYKHCSKHCSGATFIGLHRIHKIGMQAFYEVTIDKTVHSSLKVVFATTYSIPFHWCGNSSHVPTLQKIYLMFNCCKSVCAVTYYPFLVLFSSPEHYLAGMISC